MLRRIGAILYDTVLVLGLLAVLALLFLPILNGRLAVPAESGALAYLQRALQLLIIAWFFAYFWIRRGQTLGMLAWRLRITSADGGPVGLRQSLTRLLILGMLLAPYFVGDWLLFSHWPDTWRTVALYASWLPLVACYAWMWIDREHRTWHDRMSGTRLWLLPK